jgi:hypothetical protein
MHVLDNGPTKLVSRIDKVHDSAEQGANPAEALGIGYVGKNQSLSGADKLNNYVAVLEYNCIKGLSLKTNGS